MRIEHENTFKTALTNGMNLFLGAGFPVLSSDDRGQALPIGYQLSEELCSHFDVPHLVSLPLAQICAVLESTHREDLRQYLKRRFTVHSYDDLYESIVSVSARAIFTTNIDNLIYRLFDKSNTKYLNDVTVHGPILDDRKAVDYVPLHGSVVNESSSYVFTPLDIAGAFSLDPDRWNYLTQRLQRAPTLFWGYSLADADVLRALSPPPTINREHQQKWILLQEADEGTVAYFSALDFSIIEGGTEDLLEYIGDLSIAPSSRPQSGLSTKELYAEESIPDIGTVPVRPIAEFYLGAEPSWYDIFSGGLYKTSHYATVVDSINGGKDTIVLGIPAAGKTTLMMQLAAEIPFSGHKLMLNGPTPEQSRLVLRKLGEAKALCLVDNFADNIDAYSILAAAPNVVAVGFDRDYSFEHASHRLHGTSINIVDITDLTDRDLQELFSHIPVQVRTNHLTRPRVEEGLAPSLYEVVEDNIMRSALSARFAEVLTDLYDKDRVLHDLFLMCCYVHSCRTPVSFDMAYAFLREDIDGWEDVFDLVEKVGSLVTEYSGRLVDSEQSHFTPRSTIVSEAIMRRTSGVRLKRVLQRFHKEVSQFRICNYDVFKRSAYDANTVARAFMNVEEGKKFYEEIYARDQSPYLLQQGALYLNRRGQTQGAFSWIDRAIVQTQGKIPSIRNTHAVLLFRANIGSSGDPDIVARTLKQSMDILGECYRFDRRKAYHAAIYADQALEYWAVYEDETARSYLMTALEWLESETQRSPWHRNVRRLKRVVARRLREI